MTRVLYQVSLLFPANPFPNKRNLTILPTNVNLQCAPNYLQRWPDFFFCDSWKCLNMRPSFSILQLFLQNSIYLYNRMYVLENSPVSYFSMNMTQNVLMTVKISWLTWSLKHWDTVLSVELLRSSKWKTVSRAKICGQLLQVTWQDNTEVS